jgi:hypothetical protein
MAGRVRLSFSGSPELSGKKPKVIPEARSLTFAHLRHEASRLLRTRDRRVSPGSLRFWSKNRRCDDDCLVFPQEGNAPVVDVLCELGEGVVELLHWGRSSESKSFSFKVFFLKAALILHVRAYLC